jgi:acetyltransferase-like isoleucine patch superfamily enzyme
MNIHPTANLISDDIIVGNNVYIGPNVTIKSNKIRIGDHTKIEKNVSVHVPDQFVVGQCGWFTKDIKITCRSLKIGEYVVVLDRVEIGRGGCTGPNSVVEIGSGVMLCEDVVINPSEKVVIGDQVGIGAGVGIWTHGSYLQLLEGFPTQFEPVTIGHNVWLTGKSTILPGVTIGDNVVIGMMSLVNKDIPSGSLAGGVPCKVIRENVYPKELSVEEQRSMMEYLVQEWLDVLEYKGIDINSIQITITDDFIRVEDFKNLQHTAWVYYKRRSITGKGKALDLVEDLRDFLRRRGVKIYTGTPFKSIIPGIFDE